MNEYLRPVLCVVAGPNGSGKTSTTEKLLSNEWTADSFYINPDNIAQGKFGDWNSQEAVLNAAKEATRKQFSLSTELTSMTIRVIMNFLRYCTEH